MRVALIGLALLAALTAAPLGHGLMRTKPKVGRIQEPVLRLVTERDISGKRQKEDAEAFLAALRRFLESDEVCGDAASAVEGSEAVKAKLTLLFKNRSAGEGLGSLLNAYAITFAHTLTLGKRLCGHHSQTIYVNKTRCAQQGWDCLFEPTSPRCPCADLPREKMISSKTARCWDEGPDETLISNGVAFSLYPVLKEMLGEDMPFRDDHWYMALIYHYIMTPNKEVKAFQKKLREQFFADVDFSRSISAHIRRGDHWMGAHHDDAAYLTTIRTIAKESGANTVFIASDDLNILRTYPDQLKPLRVVSVPQNLSILGHLEGKCEGMSRDCRAAKELKKVGSSDEGMLLFAQIMLMRETMVTIGNIGSNFSRVIHQMQWSNAILSGEGKPHPFSRYFDMSGDHYFSCGFRLSNHRSIPNEMALREWVMHRRYLSSS